MAAHMQRRMSAAYEDFQPKLELTENPEAHLLQIHLPGFRKDQVKVRFISSTKALSVSGERPEAGLGNKWIRFSEAYPVPENCELNRIRGKFDQGILAITMPKKFISPVVPKEEPKTTEDTTTHKSTTTREEEPEDSSHGTDYDEFQPNTEMTENLDAYLLQVYLPGFTKEQVKIKYISSSRVISISGERPIEGGKRWSRVEQQYPAPENFDEERLGAKFDHGILTITMPKKFTPPKEEVKTIPDTGLSPPKEAMDEPKPQKAEPELIPPKDTSLLSSTGGTADTQESIRESKPLKGPEEIVQRASINGAVYEEFQPKSEMTEDPEAYHMKIHLPGFTKDQVKIKYVSSLNVMSVSGERPLEGGNRWIRVDQTYPVPENSDAERVRGKFDQGILTVTMPKKFISQVAPKEEVKTTPEKFPRPLEKYVTDDTQQLFPKPTLLPMSAEGSTVEGKRIENIAGIIGKGIQEVAASASNAVTNIGDGTLNDEEKHLLATVIAALGAYVSYRLTTSGKPYN